MAARPTLSPLPPALSQMRWERWTPWGWRTGNSKVRSIVGLVETTKSNFPYQPPSTPPQPPEEPPEELELEELELEELELEELEPP